MRTTFSRNSAGHRWSEHRVLDQCANDVARVDHDPLTGAKTGLLIADQVNGYGPSPSLESRWGTSSNYGIITSGGIAPDGVGFMTRLLPNDYSHTGLKDVLEGGNHDEPQPYYTSFFVRPLAKRVLQVIGYGGMSIGGGPEFDLDQPPAGIDLDITRVADDMYYVSYGYMRSGGGNNYIRSKSPESAEAAFEIWGITSYKSSTPRIDYVPSVDGSVNVAADFFDAPGALNEYGPGLHTWRNAVRMSRDPGEPTVLCTQDHRIYAKNGRFVLDGPGTLWQPDGEHAPGALVPFYWTTQFSGATPDIALGRAIDDTNWWNSHLADLVPYPRVISEAEIRRELGL